MSHGLAMTRQASRPLAQNIDAKKDELVELVKELNVLTAQDLHRTNLKTTMKLVDIQEKTFEINAIQHGLLASSGMEFCSHCDLSSTKTVQAIQDDLRSRLSRYDEFVAETKMVRKGIDKLKEKVHQQTAPSPSLESNAGAWRRYDTDDDDALRTKKSHLDGGHGRDGWGGRSVTQPSWGIERKDGHNLCTGDTSHDDWVKSRPNNCCPPKSVKDYDSWDVQTRDPWSTVHKPRDMFRDRENMSANKDLAPRRQNPTTPWGRGNQDRGFDNESLLAQRKSSETSDEGRWTVNSSNEVVWVNPVSFINGEVVTNNSDEVKVLTPSASTQYSHSSSTTDPFVDTKVYNPKYPLRNIAKEPKDKRSEDDLLAQFPWMKKTDLHTYWKKGVKSQQGNGRASSLPSPNLTEPHQNEVLD